MKQLSQQPLVSILVPLYNQERYLNACLDSICGQSYNNLEIIVVNDGSTDKSKELLSNWESKDNRIIVIDKQNEGPSLARKDGFLKATGDYVAFVDGDDILPKNSIKVLMDYMIKTGVDIVFGSMIRKLGFLKWKANNDPFPLYESVKQPELFNEHYISFFGIPTFRINMCGRMYKKSVIEKAYQETELFSEEIRFMGEDLYFNMKLFPYLSSMYAIGDVVYFYRVGGGSEDHFNPRYTDLFKLSDIRIDLLDKYNYQKGYNRLFEQYARNFFYHAHQLIEFNQADKNGVISFFMNEIKTRKIASRLFDYYSNKEIENKEIKLIVNQDYECMYDYVNKWVESRHRTMRYKVKKLFLSIIENK